MNMVFHRVVTAVSNLFFNTPQTMLTMPGQGYTIECLIKWVWYQNLYEMDIDKELWR